MQNKKAVLMSESIRIIIAVLCLIILIYLAVQIYGIFRHKTDLEKAREVLNRIVERVAELEGEGDEKEYLITGLNDWYVVSSSDKLCICDSLDSCEKSGKCADLGSFEIDSKCSSDFYDVYAYRDNCISLKGASFNIFIKREQNQIIIFPGREKMEEEIFSELLKFKKDGGSLTMKQLSEKYVDDKERSVRNELTALLESFFQKKNLMGMYYIQEKADYVKDIFSFETREDIQFVFDQAMGDVPKPKIEIIEEGEGKIYQIYFRAMEKNG